VSTVPKAHVYYSPARRTWVLLRDYQVTVNGSILCIKAGFLFDMASVPRILNPIIQKFDLGTVAPLAHDYSYQRQGVLEDAYPPVSLTRRRVDVIFSNLMISEGVRPWKRAVAFRAVRWFGWAAWKRKQREPVKAVRGR